MIYPKSMYTFLPLYIAVHMCKISLALSSLIKKVPFFYFLSKLFIIHSQNIKLVLTLESSLFHILFITSPSFHCM